MSVVFTFVVAIQLASVAGQGKEQLPRCAAVADPALFATKTWSELHAWAKQYPECDDGYLAEGVSDVVSIWLAERWKTLPALARECRRDAKFRAFVLRHIDELMTPETAAQIVINAKEKCPKQHIALCKEIVAAVRALDSH
jgi:hypothetical protein